MLCPFTYRTAEATTKLYIAMLLFMLMLLLLKTVWCYPEKYKENKKK